MGDRAGEPGLSSVGMRAAEAVAAPYLAAPHLAAPHLAAPPAAVGQRAADGSSGPVGLLRGASGKALLFIRMYERT